jgi:mRNA interferase MazF
MMFMPSSSKNDVILVRYPFSDLSGAKVRPGVVVSAPHVSEDILIVPLTSKTVSLERKYDDETATDRLAEAGELEGGDL